MIQQRPEHPPFKFARGRKRYCDRGCPPLAGSPTPKCAYISTEKSRGLIEKMIRGRLRVMNHGDVAFYCPGCKEYHYIQVRAGNEHPSWTFNGDYEKPTFSPSILVRSGHYVPGAKSDDCWCNFKERFPDEGEPPFKCGICHSFIREGKIQYLSDCTHDYAGQTIELSCPE